MTTSQASASSRAPASQPSSPASAPAASGSGSKQTPGPYSAAARQRAAQAPCSPQPTMPTLVASSRASSCVATAATAPVRSAVIERTSTSASGAPVLGRRDADHPHHDRQPGRRVARERGDPLEDREARALGRHGAEVAARRRVEVGLRRHLPAAARVLDEAVAHALDRVGRVRSRRARPPAGRRGSRARPTTLSARDAQRQAAPGAPAHRAAPVAPRPRRRRRSRPRSSSSCATPLRRPRPRGPSLSPWTRAGLLEGTRRDPAGPSPWGDDVRWGALSAEPDPTAIS